MKSGDHGNDHTVIGREEDLDLDLSVEDPPLPEPDFGEPSEVGLPGELELDADFEDDDDDTYDMASRGGTGPRPAGKRVVINGRTEDGVASSAASVYPRVQPAFQVEYPFDSNVDSATIDSSRTIYAEDIDYVWENGRRYCGDYSMPNDANEQTRQYVLHQAYLKLFDSELTTVPLEDPRYILDIGTGIGEWAIGIAEKYPDCEVFGTDIAPIQPTDQVPFNVEFHIEDAREEWIRPADTVDLVHLRNMAGAFSDWSFIYQQAFNCIKPGGYIEVMDFDDHWAFQNYLSWYPEDSPVHVIAKALREGSARDGRVKSVQHMSPQLLEQIGFVDITQNTYDLPLGRKENSVSGDDWLFAVVTGVEATCLRLLTRTLGWDPEYVRRLCDAVSRDLVKIAEDPKRSRGFVVKLRVLVGRKPQVPGQWSAQALAENGEVQEYSEDESTVNSLSIRTSVTDLPATSNTSNSS
ncbi:hypothetical protein VTK73DRAFT_600 [Phialemonium thermophilum]|uniref:Methyltransferase domain-containing protein n=1 Tax=Phialemonium thermophilum TaxID=223376 RepID=A0ABR3VUS7_9PEZI